MEQPGINYWDLYFPKQKGGKTDKRVAWFFPKEITGTNK